MDTTIRYSGRVPGGDEGDNVQFSFKGEGWDESLMAPFITLVTEHIQWVRKTSGFDVTSYFVFEHTPEVIQPWTATRANWRFSLYADTPEGLAAKLQESLQEYRTAMK